MVNHTDELLTNFTKVEQWVNSMRPHWKHLDGDVFNDTTFWNMCIHSVKPETWTAWCNVYNELDQFNPEYFARYTYIYEDTVVIASRLSKGEAMTKPFNKTGYNKPVFRATMAIKDIIAEITERPFETKAIKVTQTKQKLTAEEKLAKCEHLYQQMKELFE